MCEIKHAHTNKPCKEYSPEDITDVPTETDLRNFGHSMSCQCSDIEQRTAKCRTERKQLPISAVLYEFRCRRRHILFEQMQTYHHERYIINQTGDDSNHSTINIYIMEMGGHEVADELQRTTFDQCSHHQRNTKEIENKPHSNEFGVADVLMLDEQAITITLECKCTF